MPQDQHRSRMRAGEFLMYYLRSGYVLGVVAAPIFGLIKGVDPVSIAILAGGMVVLTLIVALLGFRRRLRADAYVAPDAPPAHLAVTDLPASANTPAERLERRRGLSLLWWSLLILSGLGLVAASAPAFTAGGFDGPSTPLSFVALFTTLLVWLPVAIMFVWSRPVLARNARIAAQRPDALVLTVFFGFSDCVAVGVTLRRVCGLRLPWWRARVPMLSTLVVDDSGLSIWRGSLRPEVQFQVPWHAVGTIAPAFVEVDTGAADSVQLGIHAGLRVREEDALVGWVDVSFLATRSNLWASFPYRSHAVIEAFAHAIEARRPNSATLYRGLTLAEVRDGVDELMAEGDRESVDELLDGLQAWIDQRGGVFPVDAGWLRQRLAERASA